ncbi:MAG: hypothetical protein ACLU84_05430 [Clostridia bacterium]
MNTCIEEKTVNQILPEELSKEERAVYSLLLPIFVEKQSFPASFTIPFHREFSMEDISSVLRQMDKKHMFCSYLLGDGNEICIVRYG